MESSDLLDLILVELVQVNGHLSYIANLAFIAVVATGVILTLMLFYTMLKRFL